MINSLLAVAEAGSGVGVGIVVVVLVSAVAGAVFSYLFLRANPNKKAVIDQEVNEISNDLKRR